MKTKFISIVVFVIKIIIENNIKCIILDYVKILILIQLKSEEINKTKYKIRTIIKIIIKHVIQIERKCKSTCITLVYLSPIFTRKNW